MDFTHYRIALLHTARVAFSVCGVVVSDSSPDMNKWRIFLLSRHSHTLHSFYWEFSLIQLYERKIHWSKPHRNDERDLHCNKLIAQVMRMVLLLDTRAIWILSFPTKKKIQSNAVSFLMHYLHRTFTTHNRPFLRVEHNHKKMCTWINST